MVGGLSDVAFPNKTHWTLTLLHIGNYAYTNTSYTRPTPITCPNTLNCATKTHHYFGPTGCSGLHHTAPPIFMYSSANPSDHYDPPHPTPKPQWTHHSPKRRPTVSPKSWDHSLFPVKESIQVKEFRYLETEFSKHGEMEGELRERAVKGKSIIRSLARVMRGRNVSMEVKRDLRNSILLPTLMYGSETDMK